MDRMKGQEQKMMEKFINMKLAFSRKFDVEEKGKITDYLVMLTFDKRQKNSR